MAGLGKDTHAGMHSDGLAVFHKTSVDAVSGSGCATAAIGGVDVEDVQLLEFRT